MLFGVTFVLQTMRGLEGKGHTLRREAGMRIYLCSKIIEKYNSANHQRVGFSGLRFHLQYRRR